MADDNNQIPSNKLQATSDKWQDPNSVLGGLKHRGGGGSKGTERMEAPAYVNSTAGVEAPIEVVEIPDSPEIEKKPDLAGYVEEVEKAAELSGPLADDYTGQVLLNPAQQKKEVVLPLTEAEIQEGLHHQVWEGVRWMAEWCVRQVKLLHGKVRYKA